MPAYEHSATPYTHKSHVCRVGQNRVYTPYMTVYLVISLPKIMYIHRVHMVLANPRFMVLTNPKITLTDLLGQPESNAWSNSKSPPPLLLSSLGNLF